MNLLNLVFIPVGLGLLGFLEPCTMGSSLVFVKTIEGKNAAVKVTHAGIFALTRALFIGTFGALAAVLGTVFLGLQKGAWIVFGLVYVVIGTAYLLGKAGILMRTLGPSLSRLSGLRGSAALGVLFGLNIPACATPLIFALLGTAVATGTAGATVTSSFFSLAVFGLALSLPLILAVLFAPARQLLDRLAGLSLRIPVWTGAVLIGLGLWSIGFGLFVSWEKWIWTI